MPVTVGVARRLELVLGGAAAFWVLRDAQYRQDLERLENAWLRQLPLREMGEFGWLDAMPRSANRAAIALKFFGVSSFREWHQRYDNVGQVVAFRASRHKHTNPAAIAAWLRQGEILADKIDCADWNPAAFREALEGIRALTRKKNPQQFLDELTRACAKTGVAVVIVRAPKHCGVSGATRFLSPNKALMLLSFRYLTDDQFWFTVFHEAGHLILHGPDQVFLESVANGDDQKENEASAFAEDIVLPPPLRQKLCTVKLSGETIIRFARKAGISPGLLVGQLQHAGKLQHSHLNSLKRRYTWA